MNYRRATIWVAWTAVAGVLLGGVIAGVSSYTTARLTFDSQKQQYIDQYRRLQRRDVEVNLLSQLAAVESAWRQAVGKYMAAGMYSGLNGGKPMPPDLFFNATRGATAKWETAFSALDAGVSTAELLSSHRVVEVLHALRLEYFRAFEKVVSDNTPPGAQETLGLPASGDLSLDPQDDPELLNQSPRQLEALYMTFSKEDLALHD